jgi:cobalt-zinc-cadmium efflux system membrane fusion protein
MKLHLLHAVVIAAFWMPQFSYAGGGHDHGHGHGHGHGHAEHAEEPAKGPHGGRLLTKDDFAVELTIFEKDVPPQFRVYAFRGETLLPAAQVKVTIVLERFLREEETFVLAAEGDYLTAKQIVAEPHSFEVHVAAEHDGKTFEWEYDSHEGRTELSEEGLKVARLEIATAGPAVISQTARVYGRLLPNEDKVAHVYPRFAGVITQIAKTLGDTVAKGELLAVIESNQSLQPYEIRSQVKGVVLKRHATLGEFVPDSREIFVVGDLSEIWADFQVYRDDFGAIEAGQKISIELGDGKEIPATVAYTSPITDEVTQSKLIRAILPNPSGALRPGLFVSGVLSGAESEVPLAVKRSAVQTFRDWQVVYLTDGHQFQAMPVELGRKDSKYVEVLAGLRVGDRYVSANSFIIKADIEKAGASHDH